MDRLQRSGTAYIKSLARRDQGDDKEKLLPVGYFGATMVSHGDDFEPDSEFGQCLAGMGRANERIARMQETYCANATSSWLESLERSLVQMKEYQNAKKKLESRRLAYDTASSKMQKSKKEDFRMEEELRNQKAKYEESSEDVYRRMLDVKEAEVDSVADLSAFLEAELTYYDRCREILLQLKRDWPAYVFLGRFGKTLADISLQTKRRADQIWHSQPSQWPIRPRTPQHTLKGRLTRPTLRRHRRRRASRAPLTSYHQLPRPIRPELASSRTPRLRLLHAPDQHHVPNAIRLRRAHQSRRPRRSPGNAASLPRPHRPDTSLRGEGRVASRKAR